MFIDVSDEYHTTIVMVEEDEDSTILRNSLNFCQTTWRHTLEDGSSRTRRKLIYLKTGIYYEVEIQYYWVTTCK
jgi:hypothetical protein